MARVAALGGTAGALLGVGLDRLLGGGAVLWAAALAFAAGGVRSASPPPARPPLHSPADAAAEPEQPPRDPMDRRTARLARPPGRVRLARTANATVRAVGGFSLFLLAFELRRQGVGTAGLGLLLAAVGVGGVVGAFLLPRAARLVREDGLLAGGLLLCGTTAGLLAGRVGVAAAAAGGLAMGAGIAAARLGFESLVQREVPPPARGTAITRAETDLPARLGRRRRPARRPAPAHHPGPVRRRRRLPGRGRHLHRRPAPPAPGSPPYPSPEAPR